MALHEAARLLDSVRRPSSGGRADRRIRRPLTSRFMGDPGGGAARVERLARDVLGSGRVEVERHPVGFGGENWKLRDGDGRRYVLKIGDVANQAKWRSSHVAYDLAADAGLPVPELVHEGELDDALVRVFTWIEGQSAATIAADDRARGARLLRSVGGAVRRLHAIGRDRFSSRLDGSAPSFAAWQDYVEHRLPQIRGRCESTGAVDAAVLDRACAAAAALAAEVSDHAEPVLCHRDLHPDNLIVDGDGALVGIIDWDAAEAWDRAGDFFKLEFELLRAHPGSEGVLVDAYLGDDEVPARWSERRRLVHILEALNILPNAVSRGWETDFADRARTHLLRLLTSDPEVAPSGS